MPFCSFRPTTILVQAFSTLSIVYVDICWLWQFWILVCQQFNFGIVEIRWRTLLILWKKYPIDSSNNFEDQYGLKSLVHKESVWGSCARRFVTPSQKKCLNKYSVSSGADSLSNFNVSPNRKQSNFLYWVTNAPAIQID